VARRCDRRRVASPNQAPLLKRTRWLLAAVAVDLVHVSVAHACGVSASGAPAGICDASDAIDDKAAAARNRIGASFGYTSSVLLFSDGLRAPTERDTVMVSFEHPMRDKRGSRWTLEFGAGSLLGGFLQTGPSSQATFSPGVIADVSLSHLIIEPHGYASPFLLLSFTLAGVWSRTSSAAMDADYVAFDFSADVAAGVSMRMKRQAITPFLAGRLFGGPVFWTHTTNAVLGMDAYHYSLGPGLALSLDRSRVGLSLGCSLLGEKNLRAGVSVAF
jgi:hypothetical protein